MRCQLALLPLLVLLTGATQGSPESGGVASMAGKGKGAAAIAAGFYQADPNHTQVRFGVSHMAISPYYGIVAGATGTLDIDPANIAAAKVDIEIPVAKLMTTSDKLTEELKSADWLDASQFPTFAFHSTKVTQTGPEAADVAGNLTIHGVTKPFVLHVKFFGAATNAMTKKPNIGFTASGAIKRSTFGVNKYVPLISDVVGLTINAAFEKSG
jgi:polyisoprenoid-binding protein YceI